MTKNKSIGIDLFSWLAEIRELCTRPSRRIGGPDRIPFKGIMPQELPDSVGLTLEEVEHWVGGDTVQRDDEALERFSRAVDAVTGATPATFKRVVWASHFLERIALEVEVRELDRRHGRAEGKPSVAEMRSGALRREVLARRFGVFKRIRSLADELGREVEVNSSNTSSELVRELGQIGRAHV